MRPALRRSSEEAGLVGLREGVRPSPLEGGCGQSGQLGQGACPSVFILILPVFACGLAESSLPTQISVLSLCVCV